MKQPEIVFNDSYKSDGFESAVDVLNKLLKSHNLSISYEFIEDHVSDDGEFAYNIKIKDVT